MAIVENYGFVHHPQIALIKRLAINEKLDFDTAKVLISEYKKVKGGN